MHANAAEIWGILSYFVKVSPFPADTDTESRESPQIRHFRHYIALKITLFLCAFEGIFTLAGVRTVVLGFFCLIVYTRRQKSVIITETRILARKLLYYQAKVDTIRQNPYTNTETN